MRVSSLILAFAVAALPTVAAAQSHPRSRSIPPQVTSSKNQLNQSDWVGTYTFQEGGGRTAGDTGIFVEHIIRVYRRGEELIADVDAAGFQVSISLRCTAKAEGDRLNLHFESYREDNVTEPYRRGQLLLSLGRSTSRGKPLILTY